MGDTVYLTFGEVVSIHDEIVERSRSPLAPLLHPDKLESALSRPQNAAYYEGSDLVRQAVLLALGVSQSQAFLDGNKRTAFAVTRVFLKVNGLTFTGDSLALARWFESVAESAGGADRAARADQFEAWLRDQVVPRPGA